MCIQSINIHNYIEYQYQSNLYINTILDINRIRSEYECM